MICLLQKKKETPISEDLAIKEALLKMVQAGFANPYGILAILGASALIGGIVKWYFDRKKTDSDEAAKAKKVAPKTATKKTETAAKTAEKKPVEKKEQPQTEAETNVTEFKLPYVEKKPVPKKEFSKQKKTSKRFRRLPKIVEWFVPTHKDNIFETARKGLVLICIILLIISTAILIKSTRLEEEAKEENSGTYFVTKYVYSYAIYQDKED